MRMEISVLKRELDFGLLDLKNFCSKRYKTWLHFLHVMFFMDLTWFCNESPFSIIHFMNYKRYKRDI